MEGGQGIARSAAVEERIVTKKGDKQMITRKVFVIYTGGTIGMVENKDGVLSPKKGAFEQLIRSYPQLHDVCEYNKLRKAGLDPTFLVLPEIKDMGLRIIYKMFEYDTLLDSSNVAEDEWIKMAEDVKNNYDQFDGFVILHGTDTLTYTASALSFMLENLCKGVVLTGSQIPIFEPRSDGTDNFVSSLIIAGGLNIPEVAVFFGTKLFRGNRIRKMSANNFYAFDSPNFSPLVEVGVGMKVNRPAVLQPTVTSAVRVQAPWPSTVTFLRLFPNISDALIRASFLPPITGVVLESFGAGNIPTNRSVLVEEIQKACRNGVIVVNITQCLNGYVGEPVYETGQVIADYVVPGYDMTPEAALTKLSYVLSRTDLSYAGKIEMMRSNIRGELTLIPPEEIEKRACMINGNSNNDHAEENN